MISCNFKSYFEIKKWLYLSVLGVYLLFIICLPINAIIFFIQTDSWMRMNRGGIYRMNQSQPNISSHIQSYHDGGIVKPAAVCVIDVNQRTKEKEKSLTALQCIVYVKIVLSSLKFKVIFFKAY